MSEEKKKSVIEIIKKKEYVDPVTGVITFVTGLSDLVEDGEVGLLMPENSNTDKIIVNPLYTGGELEVKMKIISTPARRYKEGEKIADLLVVRI